MEFGILGPLQVRDAHGRQCPLDPRQVKALAVLLLAANQLVARTQLIEAVWDDNPPATAARQLQNLISATRRRLTAAGATTSIIVAERAGYRIRVDHGQLDSQRFQEQADEAQASLAQGRTADAARQLRAGLALWRGPALTGMTGSTIQAAAARLEEQRLAALEQCLDLELQLGRHDALVGELAGLVAAQPVRERLVGQFMLALHRSGRQADALRAYQRLRDRLADELGLDPGAGVQRLHTAILRNDQALLAVTAAPAPAGMAAAAAATPAADVAAADGVVAAAAVVPAGAAVVPAGLAGAAVGAAGAAAPLVPRQLPPPPQMFTGRTTELVDLHRAGDASTVVISAIDGMAGVGKTALALHVAHQIVERFPDGQLFFDLRGYAEGTAPITPAEALDYLLRALGVPGPQVPASLDQRAALYRTRLADQRVLIVLDNAASEAQVAPLLPGAAGCLVLVTSRRRLAGLDHTHTVSLDTLPVSDAVTLFTRTAGAGRVAGQPAGSLVELVELCGRLPLAIRIAAARLRSHPTWQLGHLVERLRDQRHRLAELAAGQRSVTAALDLSYQHLSPELRRTYRMLGLLPGPDFDGYATAALVDCGVAHAGRLLDQLLDAHLLQEPAPGRYRFHDLTRAHAAQTATGDRSGAGAAALARLLDHYRHAASAAMDVAYAYEREGRPRLPPAGPATSATPAGPATPATPATPWLSGPRLSGAAEALAWLEVELPNLLAAARLATDHGLPAFTLDLSTILHLHLRIHGRHHDAETLHQRALATARAAGDRVGELHALNALGHIYWRQGRYERAADHLGRALSLARAAERSDGELTALTGLGYIDLWQGRYERAAGHFGGALRIAAAAGFRSGELNALNGLGDTHRLRGAHDLAIDHFGRALRIARAAGHHPGELNALNGLGYVHLRRGSHEQAIDHLGQALRIARVAGHRSGELNALNGLGHIYRRQGRHALAIDHLGQALRLARTIGHRPGELNALTGLGYVHTRQGWYEQAAGCYERLRVIAEASGDANGLFEAWQGLGRLCHATGDPSAAIAHYHRALALAGELSLPEDQARVHDGLARVHHALRDHRQAREHWQRALAILTGLGIDRTDDEQTTTATIRAHLAADAPLAAETALAAEAPFAAEAHAAGDAHVAGDTDLARDAQVAGDAHVAGDGQVAGDARVAGDTDLARDAQVAGEAHVAGDGQVAGDARVAGESVHPAAPHPPDSTWLAGE